VKVYKMKFLTWSIVAAVALIGVAVAQMSRPNLALGTVMSATEAHAKAVAGEVVLVDVRTPDEWRETGLPASGHAITMHQEARGLLAGLDKAMGGDRSKPLAIICRTGNRTTMLQAELKKAGYSNVINVAEGMAGGPNGTGWVKSGLPTRPGTGASIAMPQTKATCAAC
jgi:rhodanese-related sulfurtransferase